MDVHVENLQTQVRVMDEEALLSPALMRRLVEAVVARVRETERARELVERNTRITGSAARRPDRLR